VKSENPNSWQKNFFKDKTFVKNDGQYDGLSLVDNDNIKYAVDEPGFKIFFSSTGLTWRFDTWKKVSGDWLENQSKGLAPWNSQVDDEELEGGELSTSTVHMKWLNANPGTKVQSWEEVPHYYNFSMGNDPVNDINLVKGYRHILYKDLYPGIDVHYSFHPVEGIKYELLMKPGADISLVAMEYTNTQGITLNGGNLLIQTAVGDIVDHAPVTFYSDDKTPIVSSFLISGNKVTFNIGNYDHNREVTIDPWSVSPALATQNRAFDIEKDNAMDIYVYGGLNPYQVRKFNNAGTLLWVTNTLNTNQRPGDLAVDGAGNCYVTAGHNGGGVVPSISRISNAGVVLWNNSLAFNIEFWCLTATTGGAVVVGDSFGPAGGRFSDIDITNGNRLNTTAITPGTSQDNRAQCRNPAGNYFSITSDGGANERLIGVTSTFALIFNVAAIHNPPYNATPLYCNGPIPLICGYNGIAANNRYIYTNSGSTLYKRNAFNGALISSLAIPGGAVDANSGVEVDLCGNVYVGSGTGVYQYDSLLNFLSFQATSGAVYDVTLYTGTEVLACGNGFIAHQLFGNSCLVPLSVNLTNFKGKAKGPVNELEWTTANEKDNKYFILERGTDAVSFDEIGKINGAGNSTSEKSYSFIDNFPLPGLNYYRLKSVATDGRFEYSGIISLESKPQAQQVIVIPNPTSGKFRVRADGPVSIYNLFGELIMTTSDSDELDLSTYPDGVYLVQSGNAFSKLVLRK